VVQPAAIGTAAQTGQLSASMIAYRNLANTCRSPATRQVYTGALNYFMTYLQLQKGDYDKPVQRDPKTIQMDICDFVSYMRGSGRSYAVVSVYVAALSKFFAMNDITTINWLKVHSHMGEHEKVAEDRPYTHSEIQTLLNNATLRNKAIIMTMCSAGIRMGALTYLRFRDLEPIDRYHLYKVNVYARSRKSAYFCFCTPECRNAIDSYLEHRRRWGERITEDSPLYRTDYNIRRHTPEIKAVSTHSIKDLMSSLLLRTGLRKLQTETETNKHKRSHIMMTHGFRKFFETNAFKAGMDHMYLRRLMGQKSGLEDSYLKISEDELLEGDSKHTGFIGIIDQLSIDDTQRLKQENQILTMDRNRLETRLERLEQACKDFL